MVTAMKSTKSSSDGNELSASSQVEIVSEQSDIFTRQEALAILNCKETFLLYFYSRSALVWKMATIANTKQYVFSSKDLFIIRLMMYLQSEGFKREEMLEIARHANSLNLCSGLDLYWIGGHLMAIETGNYHNDLHRVMGEIFTRHVRKDRSKLYEQWYSFLGNTSDFIKELSERGLQENVFAWTSRSRETTLDLGWKPNHPGWARISSQHPDLLIPSWDYSRNSQISKQVLKVLQERTDTKLTYNEMSIPRNSSASAMQVNGKDNGIKRIPSKAPVKNLQVTDQGEDKPNQSKTLYSTGQVKQSANGKKTHTYSIR